MGDFLTRRELSDYGLLEFVENGSIFTYFNLYTVIIGYSIE